MPEEPEDRSVPITLRLKGLLSGVVLGLIVGSPAALIVFFCFTEDMATLLPLYVGIGCIAAFSILGWLFSDLLSPIAEVLLKLLAWLPI